VTLYEQNGAPRLPPAGLHAAQAITNAVPAAADVIFVAGTGLPPNISAQSG
jgi:hypothetical protein